MIFFTMTVPASVPLLFHSSKPFAPSVATKNSVPFTLVSSYGFELPAPGQGMKWHVFANTGAAVPDDVHTPGEEPVLSDQASIPVGARSVVILVGR